LFPRNALNKAAHVAAFSFLEHHMRTNVATKPVFTHEGGKASHVSPIEELRRTVLACLLWESGFYESGEAVAERIKRLVPLCSPHDVADLAIEARNKQRLRHAPLKLVRELARDSKRNPDGLVASTLTSVIQRADELAEFLSLYWNGGGKKPIAKQVKRGLAQAFQKFDEYALGKYNRDSAIKLRDVLFMVHAKPKDEAQAALWKRLVEGQLNTPDTWEVALSGGADKKEAFERLLRDGKLGYLALLRNLRNMQQAGVDTELVFGALSAWESQIDAAMQVAMGGLEKMPGRTAVLVDVSGSMSDPLSAKSDLNRLDAAAALAVLVRGVASEARVFAFSTVVREVPARQGMALIDAIGRPGGGTMVGAAVSAVRHAWPQMDRLIVITDEQSADSVGAPGCAGYMINVATNENGVGYGDWTKINGFSESVVQYIVELEQVKAR
jgi:60 kDa SS-A/Ro ribonucleoprotein